MKRYIVLSIAGILVFGGCSRKEDVVAQVGGRKITVRDFKSKLDGVPEYYMGFIKTKGGKRQYLTSMVKEEVLLKKAYELNLDKKESVRKQLKALKREVLLGAAMDYIKNNEIKISDQDVRSYYERNKEKYVNPREIKVSHILLSTYEKAEEVLNELKRGASFTATARKYSIDTVTAINGGDLGYFARGEMAEPAFEEAIFNLERVGQISDIIKTQFGYHIAKLTGKRRGDKKTFEEAREEIKQTIRDQRFKALIEDYRNEYNVRVNYDVLDDIKFNSGTADSSNKEESKDDK